MVPQHAPCTVNRQLQRRRQGTEFVQPEGLGIGVWLATLRLRLFDERMHRQQFRLGLALQPGINPAQFFKQDIDRPAIHDDVMAGENKN